MCDVVAPLCRDKQIQLLELVLCQPGAKIPPLIFIHGLSGTGKTHTVKWLLQSRNVKHAVFHCVELYNTRLLFESIIDKLSGVNSKCDNICDFISSLKKHLKSDEAYVILFEESERFRDTDIYLRQVFTRLAELTGLNISCVWESKLDWCRFLPNRDLPSPLIVHFPQYTRDEIGQLLVKSLPDDRSVQFRRNYINLLVPIFYFNTRCLPELQHVAQLNYSAYCAPLVAGECEEQDTKHLFRNIETQLQMCISTVNLREVESVQLKELMDKKEVDEKEKEMSSVKISSRKHLELPYYSKFLLISSYLASYNPQRTDRRFFVKEHGKQRKSAHSIAAKDRYNSKLTGPKPFPLERLLAIFYNIVDSRINPTANIYTQITSLVRLQLVTAIGQDTLEQPKYRCNVDLDFIKQISRTCQFDVQKYLYCQ